jgi:iron(III) transport system substrate-binding protein
MTRKLLALCLIGVGLFALACAPAAPSAAPTAAPATAAPAVQPTATKPAATAAATSAPTAAPTASAASVLDAAKKEGKVMIYTSLNADEFDTVVKEFAAKYPDIKIEFFRGSSEDVTQKALTEFRAKTYIPDVLETNDVNIVQLLNEGVTGNYVSPEAATYPAGAKDAAGAFTDDRLNLIVIAYNTSLVKPEDAPKKWEDLLDPKWKGKIGIEASDWPLIAYSTKVWGDAKAQDFWMKLAAQKPRVISGHTELANFLVAGEFAISPTVYAHRVIALQQKKAPIDMVKSDTAFAFPVMTAIAKNSPHPNAAKVFIDWLLSEAGQNALVKAGRIPVRPGIKTNPEGVLSGFNIYYGDPNSLLKAQDVQKQYNTLFGIQ